MESQLRLDNDQVIITLTNDECLQVADGGTVMDRNNPFDPMAKVEVQPLSDLDPTYKARSIHEPDFAKRMGNVVCRAQVLGNNDIIVFVPEEIVRTSYIAAEDIAADAIDGDETVVPRGGIRIEFGETVGKLNRTRVA